MPIFYKRRHGRVYSVELTSKDGRVGKFGRFNRNSDGREYLEALGWKRVGKPEFYTYELPGCDRTAKVILDFQRSRHRSNLNGLPRTGRRIRN